MRNSSLLPDSSSGVVAFVQSLDLTVGVEDLAGADMLLEGRELGVKAKNLSDLYRSTIHTQTIAPDSTLF